MGTIEDYKSSWSALPIIAAVLAMLKHKRRVNHRNLYSKSTRLLLVSWMWPVIPEVIQTWIELMDVEFEFRDQRGRSMLNDRVLITLSTTCTVSWGKLHKILEELYRFLGFTRVSL